MTHLWYQRKTLHCLVVFTKLGDHGTHLAGRVMAVSHQLFRPEKKPQNKPLGKLKLLHHHTHPTLQENSACKVMGGKDVGILNSLNLFISKLCLRLTSLHKYLWVFLVQSTTRDPQCKTHAGNQAPFFFF